MKYTILSILCILLIPTVSAVVIQGVDTNKDAYTNGDLVKLTIFTNANDLEVTGDFSSIDSGFNKDMVVVEEPSDFTYEMYYTITFGNTRSDKTYPIIVSVYNRGSDTSSVISYQLELDNTLRINQTEDVQSIELKARKRRTGDSDDTDVPTPTGESITVKAGNIVVCRPSGCDTLTEAEYEAARRIIINDGKVELSGLTYNQLKAEILSDVSTTMDIKLQAYVNQVVDIHKDISNAMNEMEKLMAKNQQMLMNQTNQTQRFIKQSKTTNMIAMSVVAVLIFGAFYLFYLKTQTTWL